jgi:hypothetical protein
VSLCKCGRIRFASAEEADLQLTLLQARARKPKKRRRGTLSYRLAFESRIYPCPDEPGVWHLKRDERGEQHDRVANGPDASP